MGTGCPRSLNTVFVVLYDEALARLKAEALNGGQIDFRVGLCLGNVLIGQEEIQILQQSDWRIMASTVERTEFEQTAMLRPSRFSRASAYW